MAACPRSTAALYLQLDVIYAQPTSGPVDPDFTQKLLGDSLEVAHCLKWYDTMMMRLGICCDACEIPICAVCLHVVAAKFVCCNTAQPETDLVTCNIAASCTDLRL